jgi:hypothetical protein
MPWVQRDHFGRQRNYRAQTQEAAELAAELAAEFGDRQAGIAVQAY